MLFLNKTLLRKLLRETLKYQFYHKEHKINLYLLKILLFYLVVQKNKKPFAVESFFNYIIKLVCTLLRKRLNLNLRYLLTSYLH